MVGFCHGGNMLGNHDDDLLSYIRNLLPPSYIPGLTQTCFQGDDLGDRWTLMGTQNHDLKKK